MRRIDIFISSPEDVRKERTLVERAIRSIAAEFGVPISVTYSNWLRKLAPSDKEAGQNGNGSGDDQTWLCPCFWEYQDSDVDHDDREEIPNTGSYDLVISVLWSRLGTKLSPALILPDGSNAQNANEYEIAWVLDQVRRTPGFPELRVYRNRSTPLVPIQPRAQREACLREWDAVQEFFAASEKRGAFAVACSDYWDLQEFDRLFREHFRDFLTRKVEEEIVPHQRPSKKLSPGSKPFRGLQFFDFEHASIFHGRAKAVGEVLDALNEQTREKKPFVLVLGASGSGKTSLVRAGVLPLLTEAGTLNGEGPWRRAITRPGCDDPFSALAAALLADGALPELQQGKARDEWRKLAIDLKEDPASVAFRVEEALELTSARELDRLLNQERDQLTAPERVESAELARHRKLRRAKPRAQLTIFIDQLEELFANGFSAELQQRYVAAVAALVRSQSVHIIAALRSDFYAFYQRFPELVALTKPTGRFDLQPPLREEVQRMIQLPAKAFGLRYDQDPKTGRNLDEALVDAALASTDALPLLEHLLFRLYEKQEARKDGLLRWSDFRKMGELEGALANHAESVFSALKDHEQGEFESIMRQLVPPQRGRVAIGRAIPYRDLVASPDLNDRREAGAKEVVERLLQEGLLCVDADPDKVLVVSLAHEVLLRRWPRLLQLASEGQEVLRMRNQLDQRVKLWLAQGCRTSGLLGPGTDLTEADRLLRDFRSWLNETQVNYIEKSLAKQRRHHRFRNRMQFAVGGSLILLAAAAGTQWRRAEVALKKVIASAPPEIAWISWNERKVADAQTNLPNKKNLQTRPNANFVAGQPDASESRLKQAEGRAQFEEKRADLAASRLRVLDAELKRAEERVHLAEKDSDFAAGQRSTLEAQLKQAQDKLREAQQAADLASAQRSALEAQFKQTQDKLHGVQQTADLAARQRSLTLEAELKQTQDKLQQAQKTADYASTQRSALEAQLKQAQDKLQQAQQTADYASTQRSALEAQLKEAQDKLVQAQQTAELAARQRNLTLEAELKQTQEKLQQAQQTTDLASTQRSDLETQLRKAEETAQVARQRADLAATQRRAMEVELRKAEEKAQLAQKIADLVAAQDHPEDNESLKREPGKGNIDSANQLRSGRALPLDTGQNPGPGISTQPLTPALQSANR